MVTIDDVREMLLPVFGFDSIIEIPPEASLIREIGADSLDFVEIVHLIERNFGVVLSTQELLAGGVSIDPATLFQDGLLTQNGADILKKVFAGQQDSILSGMTKVDVFSLLTVANLTDIINSKLENPHA